MDIHEACEYYMQQLEAAKQLLAESLEANQQLHKRELELLAVIEKQRNLLKVADDLLDFLNPSYLPDDQYRKVFDEFSCDVELSVFCDPEPSQALREHEAKVIEPYAEAWDDLLEDMELHGMHKFEPYIKSKANFRRMAEERRKK